MMDKDQIGKIINPDYPYVYAPTTEPTKLIFDDGTFKVGYFQMTTESNSLLTENKYTFLEFGEKAQNYKATNDIKYITKIDGNLLAEVEYPSYGGALAGKLKALKQINEEKKEEDWVTYRDQWVKAILDLEHLISYKWLAEYSEQKLMEFATVPIKRIDPNIGEYVTASLEITFPNINSKSIVLEPMTGITSEYNGKLDFYMRGNVYKNVSIYRKIIDTQTYQWVLAKSYSPKDHFPFNETELEKLINEWLQ